MLAITVDPKRETRALARIGAAATALFAAGAGTPACGADWADFHGSGVDVAQTQSGTRAQTAFRWSRHPPRLVWSQSLPPGESSPAVAAGLLYIGCSDGTVRCYAARTGVLHWQAASPSGAVHSPPAVAGGRVFVQTDGGDLFAMNAQTGAAAWQTQVDDPGMGWCGATVGMGRVFVGTMPSSRIWALDATSGSALWSRTLDSSLFAAPAVFGGRVYECSESTIVYAFNAVTGSTDWSHVPSDLLYSAPVISDGMLFCGAGQTMSVYAYNATTGQLAWTRACGSQVHATAAAVPGSGRIWIGDQGGRMWALSAADGSVLWTYATGGMMHSSPAWGDGAIFALAGQNALWAWDASDGRVLWTYSLPYPQATPRSVWPAGRWDRASVALDDEMLYVPATTGGALLAFDFPSPTPTPEPPVRFELSANLLRGGGAVTVEWQLLRGIFVHLVVLNTAGELVESLFRGGADSLRGSIVWNGAALGGGRAASGIYVVRLLAPPNRTMYRRIALVR